MPLDAMRTTALVIGWGGVRGELFARLAIEANQLVGERRGYPDVAARIDGDAAGVERARRNLRHLAPTFVVQQVDVVGVDLVDHPQTFGHRLEPVRLFTGCLPQNARVNLR